MNLGTNQKIREAQRKRANQRMRVEVAPLLRSPVPKRINSWNPLQVSLTSDYGLEIKTSSTGLQARDEILGSEDLYGRVQDIVVESVLDGVDEEAEAFVRDILSDLI